MAGSFPPSSVKDGPDEVGFMGKEEIMKADKWIRRWVASSDSGPGNYIVGQDADGNYGCSCRGWTSHSPRIDCKHIIRCKNGELLTEAEYTVSLMRPNK
jgi:hypothetical protein